MDCLGCRIANGIEPGVNVIYENEHVACVLDIAPFNEGHTLILPKKHYHDLDEIDAATLDAITKASVTISRLLKQLYKPDGITICQNGGVFNDLTHYHAHVIPRYQNDGFSWSEPLWEHQASTRLTDTRSIMASYLNTSLK